jgi:hypothetical protein|tara:strand:+ start:267 stop:548 length:282 start_codon:yes stop_codon:yes gene_type:complete
MNFVEAELHNDPERDWDADEEQYYLENPDEWPGETPVTDEPDPDLDEVNDWWHDLDPWGEEDPQWEPPLYDHAGVTAEGYTLLAAMDSKGEFI